MTRERLAIHTWACSLGFLRVARLAWFNDGLEVFSMVRTPNEELRDDVIAELDSDPRVDSSHVAISGDDGVVTLTGSVSSLAQKWAAEDSARRVKGVRTVVEQLQVDLPSMHQRGDADLARAITNIFYWDPRLHATVQAVVSDGFVTLTGEVEWRYQREEAEHAVRRLTGVRGISNAIALRKAPAEKDVHHELQRILHRDAQLDADNIEIEVDESKVTLSGTVRGWFERAEASRAAWSIKGVTAVENDIIVM
jgi:osmotically-inducible protein OsmY